VRRLKCTVSSVLGYLNPHIKERWPMSYVYGKFPSGNKKLCPVNYKNLVIEDAYRLDFLVGGVVVVELKTVDALLEVHEAQVLTYLRFTRCHIGLLMNFRSTTLMRGLKRLAL
jgi:GxxExxY protein